ncbi:MAG: methylenetetrahydrofolate reductase C-terminal domain-containing protein [Actinobacteria bacterium]|nr:methylenetetrahydrofolate reductase C-terminal domain-containing protein [Actinomycetota bacterium]
MKNSFKEAVLDRNGFAITAEMVPGRGSQGKGVDSILNFAADAVKGGKIHAMSLTDNAGGNPALMPDILWQDLKSIGMDALIHITCKDKNRNQLEGQLFALERAGVKNILAMSGDYPETGYEGRAKPVFDIDSVPLIKMISEMNRNELKDIKDYVSPANLNKTDFFVGGCVSPFKIHEEEQMSQYYKLVKKVRAGAQFIITQVGYDARKFEELKKFVEDRRLNVPLIANVYVLNKTVAGMMSRNEVPGCLVIPELAAEYAEASKAEDKGVGFKLEKAARLLAVVRGLKYDGAHIGGFGLTYKQVEYVIDRSQDLLADWEKWAAEFDYSPKNTFYFYQPREDSPLNSDVEFDRKKKRPSKPFIYMMFRLLHRMMFVEDKGLYRFMKWFFRVIDGKWIEEPITRMEYQIKKVTSRCQECGDCTLLDIVYLCPQGDCPKHQLNGACGGSYDGWCEVYPDEKRCIYYRAYRRLKSYREEDTMADKILPPRNWDLYRTSSWANYFLGRDHVNNYGRGKSKDNQM